MNPARQQNFHLYRQPELHKLGAMRDAKDGGLALRCKCGAWVYGETTGPLYRAGWAHIDAAKAAGR